MENPRAVVIVFAFGVPHTLRSNRKIAVIASEKARELDALVYTQLDVQIEPCIKADRIVYTEEKPGCPPPTLRIARGAVEFAMRNGLDEMWVVAAQPHLWRVLRDIKEALREKRKGDWVRVYVCDEIGQYPEDFWFCHDSTQERTRSCKAWEKRELVLQFLPFCIYKLVAS